jgi:hypothetical protein
VQSSSGLARASFEAVAPSGSVYEMEAMGEGRDVEAGMAFGGRLSNLGSVSGTLERSKVQNYERVLWRVLRGNVFLRTSDISQSVMDPKTVRSIPLIDLFHHITSPLFPVHTSLVWPLRGLHSFACREK